MKQRLLTAEEAAQYQSIIDSYHPSAQTVYNFARSRFSVIAGPTGAGKDTLRNALLAHSPTFVKILSTTSRPPRPGEQDGVEYHFKTLDFFEKGFQERSFLQAAVVHNQQISCLDIADIENLNPDQVGLSILIVQTEAELRALNPDLKTVFLVPPDLQTLLTRMQHGHEVALDEMRRRLEAAAKELRIALSKPEYYCIVNKEIDIMRVHAEKFFVNNARDSEADQAARQTAESVLTELEKANV